MPCSKRVFDILVSIIGLVLLGPFLGVIAILVKAEDGGSIIFKQSRIGFRGVPFIMYKFRTMSVDAGGYGSLLTVKGDESITGIGNVLRKYKIDELPQLFNVFKGDMSLVGPRPEVEKYVRLYSQEQIPVLELVPGITDVASLQYREENEILSMSDNPEKEYIEKIMPDKIRMNLGYAQKNTLWTDMEIILHTVFSIIK